MKRLSVQNLLKSTYGYTIMELVVSVSILAVLAASALPSYLGTQNDAKATMVQAHLVVIKQAFTNHYFDSYLETREPEFPPVPENNIMTAQWAETTLLFNNLPVTSLFSENQFPVSPFGQFYRYVQITETETGKTGIRISDQTTQLSVDYFP